MFWIDVFRDKWVLCVIIELRLDKFKFLFDFFVEYFEIFNWWRGGKFLDIEFEIIKFIFFIFFKMVYLINFLDFVIWVVFIVLFKIMLREWIKINLLIVIELILLKIKIDILVFFVFIELSLDKKMFFKEIIFRFFNFDSFNELLKIVFDVFKIFCLKYFVSFLRLFCLI